MLHLSNQSTIDGAIRVIKELEEKVVVRQISLDVKTISEMLDNQKVMDSIISASLKEYKTLGRDEFINSSIKELKVLPVKDRKYAFKIIEKVYNELCLQHRYELASVIEEVMDQVQ